MKKYLILALMFVPMVSFAAPSVRVLGTGTGTPASATSGAKVTPAKNASVAKVATSVGGTSNSAAASRIGTLRAAPKVGSGTGAAAATGTARFPVITPAHSYSSVNKPQAVGGGTTVNVDLTKYYDKEEVDNIINALEQIEDPAIDMVRVSSTGNPKSKWENNPWYQKRIDDGFVFMWIEE